MADDADTVDVAVEDILRLIQTDCPECPVERIRKSQIAVIIVRTCAEMIKENNAGRVEPRK